MPHVATHDGDDMDIDYSAFEHQSLQFEHAATGADANSRFLSAIDPLEDRGGLDGDQVAELVGMTVTVTCGPDNLNDLIGQDQAEGSFEARGVFGSDLSLEDQEEGWNRVEDESAEQGSGFVFGATRSDSAIFDQFNVAGMVGFSDAAAGAGGGGTYAYQRYTVNMRDLFGRGPVLDAADTLSLAVTIVKNNVAADVESTVRYKLIWDTATIEGDRRQFSVP